MQHGSLLFPGRLQSLWNPWWLGRLSIFSSSKYTFSGTFQWQVGLLIFFSLPFSKFSFTYFFLCQLRFFYEIALFSNPKGRGCPCRMWLVMGSSCPQPNESSSCAWNCSKLTIRSASRHKCGDWRLVLAFGAALGGGMERDDAGEAFLGLTFAVIFSNNIDPVMPRMRAVVQVSAFLLSSRNFPTLHVHINTMFESAVCGQLFAVILSHFPSVQLYLEASLWCRSLFFLTLTLLEMSDFMYRKSWALFVTCLALFVPVSS